MGGKFQTTALSPVRAKQDAGTRRLRYLAHVYTDGQTALDADFIPIQRSLIVGREPGVGRFVLDDAEASRRHAEIEVVDEDTVRVKDLGSRNGTHLFGAPIEAETLAPGSVLRIGGSLLVYCEIEVPPGIAAFAPLPRCSLARLRAEALIDTVAPSELPVLIQGPTGAGKELLATRVHQKSNRKGNLVAVNCSTFSKELIGSELFGHVAGAFSGATSARTGLFAAANDGTLFLDEIAELPLDQQPALLRAIQEKKIRPVGGDKEVNVDARVVAASHKKLSELSAAGNFRPDLFARLSGFIIEIPGLSARREEILSLFTQFVGKDAPPLSVEAAEAMLIYDWPLNVRELKHVAERAKLFIKDANRIEVGVLPPEIVQAKNDPRTTGSADDEAPTRQVLEGLLAKHEGNVAQVAKALGRHRQQLYRWLKKHDLDPESFRKEE
ncbi:MAG: sigma 54-interacting transcriptional regulator [Myxococcota bacterium]